MAFVAPPTSLESSRLTEQLGATLLGLHRAEDVGQIFKCMHIPALMRC